MFFAPLIASAPAASSSFLDQSLRFFQDGGSFMFVNVALLAIAIAVIIERVVALMFRMNLNVGPFMDQITKLVKAGNFDRADKICRAAPHSPLAKVIRGGLLHANKGELEVAKSIEEGLMEHLPPVHQRIPWLWSLANIATLVGLIGTIAGLIKTFQSLGNVPAEEKQKLLSAGISAALNNTAFGLSIAVLCIIFHLILGSHAKHLGETVELQALKLENLLGKQHEGGGRGGLHEAA